MKNLANMVVDLVCSLTFAPEEGHDPDDLAALEQGCWQTLIHDLDPEEKEAVQESCRAAIAELSSRKVDTLPEHLEAKLGVLQQFLDGELS